MSGLKRLARIEGDICLIPLTQGKTAIVDAADYALVKDFNWYAVKNSGHFYAGRTDPETRRILFLHHVIGGRPVDGKETDHRDGDGLNDRRKNLRDATKGQNMAARHKSKNLTGAKGVTLVRKLGKYSVELQKDNKRIRVGLFLTVEEAAAAYDAAALQHFGEFAVTNAMMATDGR